MLRDLYNTRSLEPPGGQLSPWQYATFEDASESSRSSSRITRIRAFLNSRTLWRTLFLLASLLLIFDITRPQSLVTWLPDTYRSSHANASDQSATATDWSQYAYCQYVTNVHYLCNSIMIFEALQRVGAKASKVMMYPEEWTLNGDNHTAELLRLAEEDYGVQLAPIKVQHLVGDATWAESFTKLLVFNQTQFRRVLSLDSDATVLGNMDELFLTPSSPVAMPRAYWLENTTFSSQLMLVEPSEFEFNRILGAFNTRKSNEFDMEIMNDLYGRDCMVFPHRKYDLITGEFREKEHHKYLGSKDEVWDAERVLDEAKFVHFSDWPLPKPWLPHSESLERTWRPECHETEDGVDCRDRDVWKSLYADFAKRRKRVCNLDIEDSPL